jgi:hypothetical protein
MFHKEHETDKFFKFVCTLQKKDLPISSHSELFLQCHVHVLQTQLLSESLLTASCKTLALLFIASCKRRSRAGEHELINIDEQD